MTGADRVKYACACPALPEETIIVGGCGKVAESVEGVRRVDLDEREVGAVDRVAAAGAAAAQADADVDVGPRGEAADES